MADKTRAEHVAWAKERAVAELERGDLAGAVASMASDMGKHPETDSPVLSFLLYDGMTSAAKGDVEGVRRWILGFN